MSTRWLIALVLVLSGSPTVSHAQDRLFVGGGQFGTNGRFGELLSENPDVMGAPLAGGRYRVAPNGLAGVQVADLQSGQHVTLAIPFSALTDRLIADPVRPRLFLRTAGQPLVAIDLPSGVQRQLFTPPPGAAVDMQYAYAAERLFVRIPDTFPATGAGALHVIDVRTGALIRTFPSWSGSETWLVTPDGRRVVYGTTAGQTMAALDVASGTVIAQAAVAPQAMFLDEAGGRVFVRHADFLPATTMTVFDLDLTPIATAALGGCARVAASPHTGRIYVVDELPEPIGVAIRMTALTAAGAPIDSRIVGRYTQPDCSGLALLTAPGAPRAVAAAVSGHDVTLTWTNVGAASHFVLDAGFASGRTDATLLLGPDAHVTFSGVPSGIYYLRLRGGNDAGGGDPSAEIRVVVP